MKTQHLPFIRNRGYTLVELLVAVAIIIILILLTVMVVSRFRELADKTKSVRNISQLQFANAAYAADNNGEFVKVFAFDEQGGSYVAWFQNSEFLEILKGSSTYSEDGSLDRSVSPDLLDPKAYRSKLKGHDTLTNSYGYNWEGTSGNNVWASPSAKRGFRASQLTAPANTAAFMTATDWIAKYSGRFHWRSKPSEGYQNGKVAYRYNGKALVAYYDGHVSEVSLADMQKIDTQGGQRNIFWDADAK